jgi:hypothetical protein
MFSIINSAFLFIFSISIALNCFSIIAYFKMSEEISTLNAEVIFLQESILKLNKTLVVESVSPYSIFTDPYVIAAVVLLGGAAVLVLYFYLGGSGSAPDVSHIDPLSRFRITDMESLDRVRDVCETSGSQTREMLYHLESSKFLSKSSIDFMEDIQLKMAKDGSYETCREGYEFFKIIADFYTKKVEQLDEVYLESNAQTATDTLLSVLDIISSI